MVDAQTGDLAGLDPAQHLAVRVVEHRRVLDADRGERGDVEEAAVAELGIAPPPAHELVVLPVVHLLGGAPTGTGGDREAVVVEGQRVAVDPQLRHVGVVAEHRQQQAAARPVDVEVARVRRRLPVAQHRPPPRVGARHLDRHVVGHDVDHDAQPELARLAHQRGALRLTAQLGPREGRIGHVVAVGRAGCGVEHGRQVDRPDAEVAQVRQQRSRLGEAEPRPQLQPVGRGRNPGCGHESTRCSTTRDRPTTSSVCPASRASAPAGSTTPSAVSTTTRHRSPYSPSGSVNVIGSW